ncbi:MAG: hypothetical protein U0324_03345 [Polyangiales bacterium]
MSDEAGQSPAGAPFRASVARTAADVLVLVERIRMHAAEVQVATQPARAWVAAVGVLFAVSSGGLAALWYLVFRIRGINEDTFWLFISAISVASVSACSASFGVFIGFSRWFAASARSYRRSHARLEESLQLAAGALGSDPALRREHLHAWLLLTEAVELGNDVLQRAPRPRRAPSEPVVSPPSSGDPTPTPPLLNKHLVNGEFH